VNAWRIWKKDIHHVMACISETNTLQS
jgi:hypothetical protein